jgi:hypothetical protein
MGLSLNSGFLSHDRFGLPVRAEFAPGCAVRLRGKDFLMAVRLLLSPPPISERVTAEALQSFLRGGSWQALVRQIAWAAIQSAAADYSCVGWLTPLLEQRLLEGIDGLEFVVAGALASTRREYLRKWPTDTFGADLVAARAAHQIASDSLERLHEELLVWAGDLLADRSGQTRSRFGRPFGRGA